MKLKWTARWSDGRNIPLGINPPWGMPADHLPDWYPEGLWLFSEQGHGQPALGGFEAHDSWVVYAASGDDAVTALFGRTV